MLNITNHQGNMNQNDNEIAPHTVKMAVIKRQEIKNASENVEKREHSNYWLECKLLGPLWRRVTRFLEKLKMELPYIQQYHFWVYIQRN